MGLYLKIQVFWDVMVYAAKQIVPTNQKIIILPSSFRVKQSRQSRPIDRTDEGIMFL